MKASVFFAFGDGVYAFSLGVGELEELQEKADAGPMEIYRRTLSGSWRMADVRETIRLGLVGGAQGWIGATLDQDGQPEGGTPIVVSSPIAIRLVSRYVSTYAAPQFDVDAPEGQRSGPIPWTESALLAGQILQAGLMGKADEPLGKKTSGEARDQNLSPGEKSDGPQSSPASPIGA